MIRQKTVFGLLRAFPDIIISSFFIMGILLLNKRLLIFTVILLITDLFNGILKESVFRPLYKTRKTIPFIGSGERPVGAMYCGTFITPDDINKKSSSFGMPSGHAQLAALVTTYWSLYLYNDYYKKSAHTIIPIVFLVFLGLLVILSRVYLNCHTVGQIIIGSMIGVILGYLSYLISEKYLC